MITLLVFVAFGSLLLPEGGRGGSGPIAEAQPIPLSYISGFTTSTLDPEVINPYRNQVVGTNSYLTMVQTSSYEFINIQPDEVVPPRFKNSQPAQYFFTVPNNEKIFSWNVPEVYYVLRVTPSDVNNFDHVQVIGQSDDANKATKIIQDEMTRIVSEYNRMVSDSDVIGGNEQENPQDDVGQGEGEVIGGIGAFSQEEVPPPKVTVTEKVDVIEDEFIVVDNGTVIGSHVNMGGSPYAGL